MCRWAFSGLLTQRDFAGSPSPPFEWLRSVPQPFPSCRRPSCEAFHFLPVPFFLQESLSSCSPLQLFAPRQSGSVCVCFPLPIPILLCPIPHPSVFPYHEVKLPLRISGSSRLCSFHSLHLLFSFQALRYWVAH